MSTYSTDLKIEEIGTGEQAGTWGTTTNDNFQNVFEQAIVGRVTVPFTDANVTLTATNSVASQSFRNVYLNCTGTNTASRNLVVPTINKNYVVQNNTTGGFTVVVKTTAGTGITIPNGSTCTVYADGTNVIQAFDYLPVATVGTLTITSISTTNLSVSGVATFAAGTVSLPSITTAGDTNTGIYFPAADTIAFTEGGVESMRINSSGNLGIGTASPATRLDVVGSGGGSYQMVVSDNANQGFIKLSKSGGLYGIAAGADYAGMLFYTNSATARVIIDNSGNVGIGTGSPSVSLDVSTAQGIIRATSTTGINTSYLAANNTGGYLYLGRENSTGATFGSSVAYASVISSTNAYPLITQVNGAERMRITSTGLVGIGLTPSVKLDVSLGGTPPSASAGTVARFTEATGSGYDAFAAIIAGNNGSSALHFGDTDLQAPGAIAYAHGTTNAMAFSTNATEKMRIDSAGNVGIGTVIPSSYGKLAVSDGTIVFSVNPYAAGSTLYSGVYTNHPYAFIQNNLERMRLDTSGNLAVGTTTAGTRLTVVSAGSAASETVLTLNNPYTSGSAVASTGLLFGYHTGSSYRPAAKIEAGQETAGTFASGYLDFYTQSSEIIPATPQMRISSGGNLSIGTTGSTARLCVVTATAKATATTINSAVFSSNDTPGSADLLLGIRQGGSATQSARWTGFQSYENGYGVQDLVLQDLGGNVGIGSTSPSYKLDVVSSANTVARFYNNNGGGNTDIYVNNTDNASDWLISRRSNGECWSYSSGSSPLVFLTNASERMRIDSSGNVLIGVSAQAMGSSNTLACKTIQRQNSGSAAMSGSTWVNLFLLDNTASRCGGNIYVTTTENGANNVYFAKWTFAYGASNGTPYTLSGPFDAALVGNTYAVPNLRISGGYIQIQANNGISTGSVNCFIEYFPFT